MRRSEECSKSWDERKNNPLLTGPAGVGKTAIIEALAQRISDGKVPPILSGKQIYSLDMNAMLAGARYRGDFEERLKGVMEDVKKEAGRVIIFIDEIHSIVGAGRGEGAQDAANILNLHWQEVIYTVLVQQLLKNTEST